MWISIIWLLLIGFFSWHLKSYVGPDTVVFKKSVKKWYFGKKLINIFPICFQNYVFFFIFGKLIIKNLKIWYAFFKCTPNLLLKSCVLGYNYQTFEQFLASFLLVGRLIQNLFLIQNDGGPYSSLKIFVLNYNSIGDPKMKKN